jgi:hypothetical protein
MTRSSLPLRLAVLAVVLLLRDETAAAFAPDATARVAAHMSRGLPSEARWTTIWDDALTASVAAGTDPAEPEAAAARRRCVALAPPTTLEARSCDRVDGAAIVELAEAVHGLEHAFARGDPAAIVIAARRLVTSSVDLADPFLTTPPDPNETPGARAWLGQPMDTDVPVALSPLAANWQTEPLAQAVGLAQRSAATRPKVEDAARRGDENAIAALRRERLNDALDISAALTRRAWERAGAPALGGNEAQSWVLPNPARSGAVIDFTTVAVGPAWLEVFDVAGRRVERRDLGTLLQGPHRVPIEGEGIRLGCGVYMARVTCAAGRVLIARFVVAGR